MIERRCFLRIVVGSTGSLLLSHAPLGLAQTTPVRVKRKEPVITRTAFDPRRPPANMAKLTPPEAGVCNTQFELDIGIGYSMETESAGQMKVFVDELDLETGLTLSIFTQQESPDKLRAHEEGHRAIGEYYYKNAHKIAEAVGKSIIGKEFVGTGANKAAAEQDGYQKANDAIEDAYMARTRVRAFAANNRFDEVTQHGLNAVAEAGAIEMAVSFDPEV